MALAQASFSLDAPLKADAATPAPAPSEDRTAAISPPEAPPFAAVPLGATPLMAQYLSLKAQHADCLLLFRLGDFYEMFFEDAVSASKALDIALTRRGQMGGQDIPMCGVPAHSYENYLSRLIKQGFRVALCEQKETPLEAKKRGAKSIVVREVVRVITPGTLTEDSLLDAKSANYLAALVQQGEEIALAWFDLAGGQPETETLSMRDLTAALARINPSEILLAQRSFDDPEMRHHLGIWRERLTPQPDSRFDSENARRRLGTIYKVNDLSAFGNFSRGETAALGALLDYASLTQRSDLLHLAAPRQCSASTIVLIDAATRRNLEITKTLNGERKGSLLAAIDRTVTTAGARLLCLRLTAPLTDKNLIEKRLDAVTALYQHEDLRTALRASLHATPDLERALARLVLGRGGPRDLMSVKDALLEATKVRHLFEASQNEDWGEVRDEIAKLPKKSALADHLAKALDKDLPILARDGNFIAAHYSADLDRLISLRDNGKRLIAALQQKYADHSTITSLKIRHNNVLGYYIEVTAANAEKLHAEKDLFIHRQSLAGVHRFTTVELGQLARQITDAGDQALSLELTLFDELRVLVTDELSHLKAVAHALSVIDVAQSLAILAFECRYCRPSIDYSLTFNIKGGRHPVVEQALSSSAQKFVGNDCDLSEQSRLWLLTGPNMAGKSTFLRQNALIALLAQMGSFVPAEEAHLGVIDRLFSRVGAADDLAAGRSTFMVEMVETAIILNQAGPRTLVILDEIGRGTATFDGLSIAWATIEHLHEKNRCRALFATHYHELTALTEKLPALSCHAMAIKEWEQDIIFLHEVREGTADRSYGIHVARMAGLPKEVIARAEAVLSMLETDTKRQHTLSSLPREPTQNEASKGHLVPAALLQLLDRLDPDRLTPKDALELLYEMKSHLPDAIPGRRKSSL